MCVCGGGGCLCVHVKCMWLCLVPDNHRWMLVKLDSVAMSDCNSYVRRERLVCTQFTCGCTSL